MTPLSCTATTDHQGGCASQGELRSPSPTARAEVLCDLSPGLSSTPFSLLDCLEHRCLRTVGYLFHSLLAGEQCWAQGKCSAIISGWTKSPLTWLNVPCSFSHIPQDLVSDWFLHCLSSPSPALWVGLD
jgi:hypothetical protein